MRRSVGILLGGVLLTTPLWGGTLERSAPERVSVPILLDAGGCRGCHRIEGRGGSQGPDLTGVGQRFSRERLRLQLLQPARLDTATTMPAYDHLVPAEIELLLDFLARQ